MNARKPPRRIHLFRRIGILEQPADGAGGGERLDILCDAGKIVCGIDGALGDHFLMGDELLFEDVLGVMVAEPRHDPVDRTTASRTGANSVRRFGMWSGCVCGRRAESVDGEIILAF